MTLSFGPGARATARLEVSEHAAFPLFEAITVHVPAGGASFVVTEHADRILGAHRVPWTQALAGYAAAPSFLRFALTGSALPPRSHADAPPPSNEIERIAREEGARQTKHILPEARAAD
ncbi:hypothetical protein EVAR_18748_1 [Eumeta japonica]|uniref:Uncharacterized protein n=1 Tax=Eumeta variegata TaxID=151549 RepID=A0A4C1UNY9_EUMVA|nr:hypothetical protein EVAR_18748_1 [Eumeta japonica]